MIGAVGCRRAAPSPYTHQLRLAPGRPRRAALVFLSRKRTGDHPERLLRGYAGVLRAARASARAREGLWREWPDFCIEFNGPTDQLRGH